MFAYLRNKDILADNFKRTLIIFMVLITIKLVTVAIFTFGYDHNHEEIQQLEMMSIMCNIDLFIRNFVGVLSYTLLFSLKRVEIQVNPIFETPE